jgi:hypothetical protein
MCSSSNIFIYDTCTGDVLKTMAAIKSSISPVVVYDKFKWLSFPFHIDQLLNISSHDHHILCSLFICDETSFLINVTFIHGDDLCNKNCLLEMTAIVFFILLLSLYCLTTDGNQYHGRWLWKTLTISSTPHDKQESNSHSSGVCYWLHRVRLTTDRSQTHKPWLW